MRLNQLKTIRIGLSLLFFLAISLLFLDFRNWFAPVLSQVVLYPQFIPSTLQWLQGAALSASGFLVILLVTLCVGRVYCSTLCPLGTLQDVAGFLARKKAPRPVQYRSPSRRLRYALLALTVLFFVAGSNLLLNLLDPFSTFGRIVANLLRPVGIVINNIVALGLEQFGIYALAREQWATMAPLATGLAAASLFLVLWLATVHGRLYCNTLCPVGTLLGLVSRFSLLRLQLDEASCTNCQRCSRSCKAGCIDLDGKTIDMSRCVACYSCLAVCQTHGVQFVWRGKLNLKQPANTADPHRRRFLSTAGITLLAGLGDPRQLFALTKATRRPARPTTVAEVKNSPISPPGSRSVAQFTTTCTACHLCVSACPSQVLLPALLEYGLAGFMQPRLHFHTGHCTYECTVCGQVCPTGAIHPLTVEQKRITQTGVAQFIKDNCVVFTDHTACGACSEHCPTKAVTMIPFANPQGKPLGIPDITRELCIGCGGCEHACPTRPYKAIFVDGNPVHALARKPVEEKIEQQVDYQEDFPF